jgi:hypothetical protein
VIVPLELPAEELELEPELELELDELPHAASTTAQTAARLAAINDLLCVLKAFLLMKLLGWGPNNLGDARGVCGADRASARRPNQSATHGAQPAPPRVYIRFESDPESG